MLLSSMVMSLHAEFLPSSASKMVTLAQLFPMKMLHVSVLLIHMNVHIMVTTLVMVKYVLKRLNAIPMMSTSMNDMTSLVDNIDRYHNEYLIKSFKDLHSIHKLTPMLVAIKKC